MNLVIVKAKFQIVIPQDVRKQAGVGIGDLLEASVEHGKITLTPKSLVDRHIAEGLEDLRQGRTSGPYASGSAVIAALEAKSIKGKVKAKR